MPMRPPPMRPPWARSFPVFAALAVGLLMTSLGASHAQANPAAPMAKAQVLLKAGAITVDVADTPALQQRGLGGRQHLGPWEGMLFVYDQPGRYTFWMKGMFIPIDILWIQNHTVVHVAARVPPPAPGTPDAQLPTHTPSAPANFVLELAAGRAQALGLIPGAQVDFRF